jgi:hypothetical protein
VSRIAVYALAGLLFAAAPAAAQTLHTGTWTGTIAPPDGGVVDVEYEVSVTNDEIGITLVFEMGTFEFASIEFDGSVLSFTWSPGVNLTCELELQDDGSFEGECVDEGGESGFLTMNPPGHR